MNLSDLQKAREVLRKMREGKTWEAIEGVLTAYVVAVATQQQLAADLADAEATLTRRRGEIGGALTSLQGSFEECRAQLERERTEGLARIAADAATAETAKRQLGEQIAALVAERTALQQELVAARAAHDKALETLAAEAREAQKTRDAAHETLRALREQIAV